MPDLSLTDLVDVSASSGTPKMTKVRQIKNRPAYDPKIDFYRPFRERILAIHQEGLPKSELSDIVPSLTDPKKVTNYPSLVDGYRQWWGRKSLTWFSPPSLIWSAHGVDVRVNPELGLVINEVPHLIKMYLKADPLTKNRIEIITHLMDMTLSASCPVNTVMAVLDVRNHRLLTPTVPVAGLTAGLDAELAYVAALWPNV